MRFNTKIASNYDLVKRTVIMICLIWHDWLMYKKSCLKDHNLRIDSGIK